MLTKMEVPKSHCLRSVPLCATITAGFAVVLVQPLCCTSRTRYVPGINPVKL